MIPGAVTQFKKAAVNAVRGMEKHHTMAFAAALSFRFTFPTTSMRGLSLLRCCQRLGFYSTGIALASEGVSRERSQ